MVVTLPDQHLTRPCLAESVLVIALGSGVSRVDSLVQMQCIIAFKTQSAELKSSETLVCVLVGSRLKWLVDHVSSWGTTRTDTCFLWEMGPFISNVTAFIWCIIATCHAIYFHFRVHTQFDMHPFVMAGLHNLLFEIDWPLKHPFVLDLVPLFHVTGGRLLNMRTS